MFKKIAGKTRLKVEASTPYDEIFLIDGGYQRVAGGVGKLDVKNLNPGLYKLKFKTGNNIVEQSVLLNQPLLKVRGPQIELASPVPLPSVTGSLAEGADSLTARPASAFTRRRVPVAKRRAAPVRAAAKKKALPRNAAGHTGVLFYVSAAKREIPGDLFDSLDLFDEDGRRLKFNVREEPQSLSAEMNCRPGFLRLRVDLGDLGKVEMPIWAIRNYRTCVFLPLAEFGVTDIQIRPDILKGGVCMSKGTQDESPNWEIMRQTEQARISLQEGRAAILHSEIQRMLRAKFQDPMGGILAAHLLLLEKRIDARLFDAVTGNLLGIAPDHPDIRILRAWNDKLAGRQGETWELRHPPLLSASWRLLNDSWMKSRIHIPDNSIAGRITARLWGQSVWLLWRAIDSHKIISSRKTK